MMFPSNKAKKSVSKKNSINSIKVGKVMPMKRPRPPPMLFRKVKVSIFGIWVIFSELKSRKENNK